VKLSLPSMDLGLVVRSHGWYDLPPFEWVAEEQRLIFLFLEGECPVRVEIQKRAKNVMVHASPVAPSAPRKPSLPFKENLSSMPPSRAAVRRVLERVLDLKADLSLFHSSCTAARGGSCARRRCSRMP